MSKYLFLAISLLLSIHAHSETFSSDARQTPLLELYTSEGCSSCPPADRWMSSLKEEKGLWNDFIPLAFHVDYWDYIGWKDQFADPQYSDRQRQYASEQSLNTVYTPGFIYRGEEWRGWFVKRYLGFNQGEEVGVLTMDIHADTAELVFNPADDTSYSLRYNIAILGFDVKTEVKRGENRGKTLNHDFVVLNYLQGDLKFSDKVAVISDLPLPTINQSNVSLAVVAWVNSTDSLKPIQAVGGYLKKD